MIPTPGNARISLALGRTYVRRGMRSLALQVQQVLKKDVHAGDLFVFRGRSGSLCKILWYDGMAMSLYCRCLACRVVPLLERIAADKAIPELAREPFALQRKEYAQLQCEIERVAPPARTAVAA